MHSLRTQASASRLKGMNVYKLVLIDVQCGVHAAHRINALDYTVMEFILHDGPGASGGSTLEPGPELLQTHNNENSRGK